MLTDIISELASDLGIQISIPTEKSYLLDKINKAAKEVYNSNLLRGCEMEQLFEVDTDTQQISLPPYVGRLLNIRHHYMRSPINNESLRPHYIQQAWVPPYLNWRVKAPSAPLSRITDQVAPLTFTLAQPATEAFVITIAGRTLDARHKVETIAFAIGDTAHDSVGAYYQEDVEYIKKSRTTEFDITITDLDGTEVGQIYNNMLASQYMVVNIMDWLYEPRAAENRFVEVLFKPRFQEYVEDTDIFCAGEIYERAVYYKAMSYMLAKQEGKAEDAIIASQACDAYLNQVANEMKSSEAVRLKFKMPIIYQFKFLSRTWSYRQTGLN